MTSLSFKRNYWKNVFKHDFFLFVQISNFEIQSEKSLDAKLYCGSWVAILNKVPAGDLFAHKNSRRESGGKRQAKCV
jgi:hypothetical protein